LAIAELALALEVAPAVLLDLRHAALGRLRLCLRLVEAAPRRLELGLELGALARPFVAGLVGGGGRRPLGLLARRSDLVRQALVELTAKLRRLGLDAALGVDAGALLGGANGLADSLLDVALALAAKRAGLRAQPFRGGAARRGGVGGTA